MPAISENSIVELIKYGRPLSPEDSVSRAVSIIRANGGGAAPVVSGMQVVGILRETDILPLLTNHGNGASVDLEQLPPVSSVMQPPSAYLPDNSTIGDAVKVFSETGEEALPVVTSFGGYIGYLQRSDVLAALSNTIRPAVIGGLATPFGVHLTCGSQRGGATDRQLIGLGICFGVLIWGGFLVAALLAYLGQKAFGPPLFAALMSEPISKPNIYDALQWVVAIFPVLAVLLGIRFTRMSGYHAAEHQTVHAIEQGEPLEYDSVRRMPRVHPRCGTNIAAASTIFIALISVYPNPLLVFGAILFVLFTWRTVGYWLQQHVTTRPASKKEIINGIQAAKELLANYREEVLGARPAGKRLWNLGFIQIFAGFFIVSAIKFAVSFYLLKVHGIQSPFF